MFRSKFTFILLLFVTICVASSNAEADTINFETDTPGFRFNPFQSVQSNIVTFSNSRPFILEIIRQPGSVEADGTSLLVYGLADAELVMSFSVPVNNLSFAFGNDDPMGTVPGDYALLQVFNGSLSVGQSIVIMNRDDAINQRISFSGSQFNRATFRYVASNQFLGEIVDNIEFTQASTIPEPASLILLGSGLSGISVLVRKRNKAKGN